MTGKNWDSEFSILFHHGHVTNNCEKFYVNLFPRVNEILIPFILCYRELSAKGFISYYMQ